MLSVDQYQTLVGNVPAITKELRKHGVKIAGGDAAAEDDAEEEDEDEKPAKSSKKGSKSKKANIEATSDEAEDSD